MVFSPPSCCDKKPMSTYARRLANFMCQSVLSRFVSPTPSYSFIGSPKSYSGSGTQNKTSFSALAIMLCRGLYPTTLAGRCEGSSVAGSKTA